MIAVWKQWARRLKIETYALVLAYRDPRVPLAARIFAALIVAYTFSPIDLIPDFIPILGYLDDLILVPLGITLALKMIPREVMEECRQQSQRYFFEERPLSKLGLAIMLLLWILLAALALYPLCPLFGK